MTKLSVTYTLVLLVLLTGCTTYKKSFGTTYTKVESAAAHKTYRLDLSNQNLEELPQSIEACTQLKMLKLSGNSH